MIRNAITDKLKSDDRGVSPVIGVILMVAITVILAAVIGTFVLDIGQSAGDTAPSASLTVEANSGSDDLEINHKGGDGIQTEDTRILVSNETTSADFAPVANGGVFGVGDTATVYLNGNNGEINAVDWPDGDTAEDTADPFSGFPSGDTLEVQIIDTQSQRVIFETQITA